MTPPSVDWNIGLAEDLRKPGFARGFLIACMDEEEGLPLQYALGKVIRALGVKEFAAKVGMSEASVRRAINRRHNPTLETLDRLLKPLGLRICLTPIAAGAPAQAKRSGTRQRRERRNPSRAAA
jgi:probable addiction module antidote protein